MKGVFLYLVVGLMLIGGGLVGLVLYDGIKSSSTESLFDQKKAGSVSEPFDQAESNLPPNQPSVYVPILMYHYIRDYQNQDDPLGIQLSVSPQAFDKQLSILKKAGYETISLEDFANGKYQPKSIVLTFDDGYDNHVTEALPILQKYNYSATFFVVSGFVGRTYYMTAPQIQQLKLAGMEIGGHTITHLNLANASYEKAITEISTSLRSRDPVFAYPSGKYNPTTLDVVSGLGVKAAVTTNIGVATEKSNFFELPRIRVKEQTDLLKRIDEETAIAARQKTPSQRSRD